LDTFWKTFSKRCFGPVNAKIPVARPSVEISFAFIDCAGYVEELETLGYEEADGAWYAM